MVDFIGTGDTWWIALLGLVVLAAVLCHPRQDYRDAQDIDAEAGDGRRPDPRTR
jgi:hypothetical protein